jgi:uncharacterized membrane protein
VDHTSEDGPADQVAAGRQVEVTDSAALAGAAGRVAVVVRAEVGNAMRTKEFLSRLEHDRIVRAIRATESKTSGEIRVHIQRGKMAADPLAVAEKKFHSLGMHKTRDRDAVLIFIAPRAHKFAVFGDKAIHEKCGEALWQRVVDKMRQHFRNENFTDALVEAIEEVGSVLATEFPRKSGDTGNELADEVTEG